ncbi:hypothetical protein DNTS_031629 [Danionella cerebrum]|uniref:Nicastrin n=1 Tax=Danionella cerebrum TaxID=2873325 RepID=A0A553QW03_9TELE|nr:hypothetical protein DNTS_031629 [Danionella translucida]
MRKMGEISLINCFWLLLTALFPSCVFCSSVEQKIYIKLNETSPCVRLLNATHQIGCRSSISGDTGVIQFLEGRTDLDWILSSGPHPPYMVVMETAFFTRTVMMEMKNSSRVAGVAVIISKKGVGSSFSPHTSCPNQDTGVYSARYGPEFARCNTTIWNPLGNGLSYEDFPFPVFALKDENQTQIIRRCYEDHNQQVNGSAPRFPLCAMQLFSHMHAVVDTVTCMRRSDLQNQFSINPVELCDPLSDYNVWTSTQALNNSAKGHAKNQSVIIAAARLDGRSFFWEEAPAAEGTVSGFIALLAAVQALRAVTREAPPRRNILFTFFQGEAFDYIGSSRMVFDMEQKKFAIDMDNVHGVLEIGQVGLRGGDLWIHSDPVSRQNSSIGDKVNTTVQELISISKGLNVSLKEPQVSQPLPPSSFQRFLRSRPIPGVVLTDHETHFNNSHFFSTLAFSHFVFLSENVTAGRSRYYESMYDDAENLNVTYPPNLTPEEQLVHVTAAAESLAAVGTLVARSLYLQADGDMSRLQEIRADTTTVAQLLYGFLVEKNNSWFRSLLPPDISKPASSILGPGPPQFYIGLRQEGSSRIHLVTLIVQHVLANMTGTITNLTETQCRNPGDVSTADRDFYSYFWVSGASSLNSSESASGSCVRASVRLSKAVSPAFEKHEYGSRDFSTWTESRWSKIEARVFLQASPELQMLTLGVGVAVLMSSLLVTYFISSKAELLFGSAPRETPTTTY